MNDRMPAGMDEVMRLTRSGQVVEATTAIQHLLGGNPISKAPAAEPDGSEPIEAEFHVVEEAPSMSETQSGTPHQAGTRARTLHPPIGSGISPDMLQRHGWRANTGRHTQRGKPDEKSRIVYAGGKLVDRAYTNAAGTRAYKLYIPGGYTGQAAPLVVMLHGCTQTPLDFAAGTGMNVLAERETFLVAYPEQAAAANGSRCWNWFQESEQRRGSGEPSIIAGITQQIIKEYHADSSRVYVAGMSAGGAMAVVMAATYPDLYAALGVHSGLAYGSAHDLHSALSAMKQGTAQVRQLPRRVPLIMFHGDHDRTVAPANTDRLLEQWLHGTGPSIRGTQVERGQVSNGHAYTRTIYYDGTGQATIEKWVIHKAGHAWSGGNPAGSFTDRRGTDASAEMVRFFRQHPRRK